MNQLERITVKTDDGGTMELTPHELEFIKAYRAADANLKLDVDLILETDCSRITDTGQRISLMPPPAGKKK